MPDSIERILETIYEKGNRQRHSSSREVPQAKGVYDELPIAIGFGSADLTTQPVWADFATNQEIQDRMNNTGNSDITLQTHTSDVGSGAWRLNGGGQLSIATNDRLFESGAADAVYVCDRTAGAGSANHWVSMVMRGSTSVTQVGGLIFRHSGSGTSNYWRYYAGTTQGTLLLQKVVSNVITTVGSSITTISPGDCLRVRAVGSEIHCFLNGQIKISHNSGTLMANGSVGVYWPNGGSSEAASTDFHAWNLSGTMYNFGVNPGHTIWGAHGDEHWSWRKQSYQELSFDRFQTDKTQNLPSRVTPGALLPWSTVGSASFTNDVKGYVSGTNCIDVVNPTGVSDMRILVTTRNSGSSLFNGSAGLAFRVAGSNNYWRFGRGTATTAYHLVKIQNGVGTLIFNTEVTANLNDKIEVRAISSTIQLWVNQVFRGTAIDTFNQGSTQHGLYTLDPAMRLGPFRLWKALDIV